MSEGASGDEMRAELARLTAVVSELSRNNVLAVAALHTAERRAKAAEMELDKCIKALAIADVLVAQAETQGKVFEAQNAELVRLSTALTDLEVRLVRESEEVERLQKVVEAAVFVINCIDDDDLVAIHDHGGGSCLHELRAALNTLDKTTAPSC